MIAEFESRILALIDNMVDTGAGNVGQFVSEGDAGVVL